MDTGSQSALTPMSGSSNVSSGATDDPYAVNNNEITGNSIVSEVLAGKRNFVNWKKSMEIALSARSKLGFVNGKYPKPTDSCMVDKWQRCNDAIMSWLLASVSPIVHGQILHAKDVATAWKILHTRYAGSNVSRKFALKRDLGNMKQGDLDVAHYYAKLAKFWEELEAISSVRYLNCVIGDKCEKCTEMESEREEDKVIQFLMGLNDSHAQVRTNILALRVIPDMDVVYDMVAEDESQQSVTKAPCEEMSAMYVQNSESNSRQMQGTVNNGGNRQHQGGSRGPPRPRLYCSHCHMAGHTKEFCYKLVGFPPSSKFPRSSNAQGNKSNNSYKGPMSNAVGTNCGQSTANINSEKGHTNVVKDVSIPQLSQDQWDKLLTLITPSSKDKDSADNKVYMAGPNIQEYPADW